MLPFLRGLVIPVIGKTTKHTNALLKKEFTKAKVSLTKEQFIVLCYLQGGAKPQNSLAMITERNKGSLTRLVQTLERNEYIIRKCCKKDHRVNFVEISEKGQAIFEKTKPIVTAVYSKAQENISEEDLRITISVLEKIQQNSNLKD